jgi:hypothetical protein
VKQSSKNKGNKVPYNIKTVMGEGDVDHVEYDDKWKFYSIDDIREFQERNKNVITACRLILSELHVQNAEKIKSSMGKQRFANNPGGGERYKCQHPWPADSYLQACDAEVVKTGGPKNQEEECDAYFEALLLSPDTTIMADAKTIEEAENMAWEKYQKIVNCSEHEFISGGQFNMTGICKHCDLILQNKFEPTTTCKVCGKVTAHTIGDDSNIHYEEYCEDHCNDRNETNSKSKIINLSNTEYLESLQKKREKNIEETLQLEYYQIEARLIMELIMKV